MEKNSEQLISAWMITADKMKKHERLSNVFYVQVPRLIDRISDRQH